MFFSWRFREGKCVANIKRVLCFMRACIKLFYIILDNFSLVRAPAKAYFFPFISFFYRSILLTSIFLSPFAKYGLFFFTASLPFRQSSHFLPTLIYSHHHTLFFLSFLSSTVRSSVGIYVLIHCVARYLELILTFRRAEQNFSDVFSVFLMRYCGYCCLGTNNVD